MFTPEQVQAYERDGFVIVDDVFNPEEVRTLLDQVGPGGKVAKHTSNMPDADGRSSKLALWMDTDGDVFGAVSVSPRIVTRARMLLREDVYHWHSKVMLKEARTGGAWEWHQDYGYWYGDGCPYPRMVSCMLALDTATKENGCLKVIPGSHLLGRLDHGKRAGQAGADVERVALIEQKLGVRYCEAKAGSVLFFHANLLHASEANLSDFPRRAYICCYNAFSNIPIGGRGHGKPVPIVLSPDDAIARFAALR